MTETDKRKGGAFFGRRHGKALRQGQAVSLERQLGSRGLDLRFSAPQDIAGLFATPVNRLRLEIGFGGGEHLLYEAGRFPQTGFIGVEPFVNGMAKVTAALERQPLANIRLYGDDASHVLDWLPDAGLDGIDLFYPDPWPKKKHWKRRFVSQPSLTRFARVLKPGGLFRFASDIDTYVNWTLQHCRRSNHFEWTAEGPDDWRNPYDGWPGTRYEAKAIREGRTPAYLAFRRV